MFKFDLQGNEELQKMRRQSELVLAGPVLIVMALIYIPATFLLKYDLFFANRWIMFFWSFILLLYFVHKYLLWLLNCYLFTTKRVIVITQRSIFSKEVSEAPLQTIQNVKYITHGLPGLIGLGDVEVKVSGLEQALVLKNQSRPGQLKDFLWQQIKRPEVKDTEEKPQTTYTQVIRPVIRVGSEPKKPNRVV